MEEMPFLNALVILIVPMLMAACAPRPPSSADPATEFVSTLEKRSPTNDGAPLRTYCIRNIDHDGKFEVLECVSAYENAPGFLNVEVAPAFEWITIYREQDGRFVEATKDFPQFLAERKEHYKFWFRVLDHPDAMSQDSQALIEKNKEEFRKVILGYMQRLEQLEH
jgi:hypothetical protein